MSHGPNWARLCWAAYLIFKEKRDPKPPRTKQWKSIRKSSKKKFKGQLFIWPRNKVRLLIWPEFFRSCLFGPKVKICYFFWPYVSLEGVTVSSAMQEDRFAPA